MIVRFKVLGKPWRIRILTKKKYRKKHGKDSVAMCKGWKREIDLSPWGYDLETIVHEVTHAYFYEMAAKQTVESQTALEEFFCELVARRGDELIKLTRHVHQKVKKLTLRRPS